MQPGYYSAQHILELGLDDYVSSTGFFFFWHFIVKRLQPHDQEGRLMADVVSIYPYAMPTRTFFTTCFFFFFRLSQLQKEIMKQIAHQCGLKTSLKTKKTFFMLQTFSISRQHFRTKILAQISSICNQLPIAMVESVQIQSMRARNSNKNGMARNLQIILKKQTDVRKYYFM